MHDREREHRGEECALRAAELEKYRLLMPHSPDLTAVAAPTMRQPLP